MSETNEQLVMRLHSERSASRDDVTIGVDEVDGMAAGFVGVGTGPAGFGESLTVGVDGGGLARVSVAFGQARCSVALPWASVLEMVRGVEASRTAEVAR